MQNRITCAIHQPNLFPRLSTLAKLYAADIWVVLDDVQFNGRDYQHRARLAVLENAHQQQWITLPVHKPLGRNTRINEVRLLEQLKSARRVGQLVQQHYGRAPYWSALAPFVQTVAAATSTSGRLADVTELSTRLLLEYLGWRGRVVRSSSLIASPERSARLADLAYGVGATEYLCGTGGAKYLSVAPFVTRGIDVRYYSLPEGTKLRLGGKVSALYWLATTERATLLETILGNSCCGVQLAR
jgi:WbqC-like protein family